MSEETTQFINVVFDPNFTSFETDLASMSLDKMMSIQFSEDVLQKNFTVIITILKQLHKGMVLMNGNLQDNKEWISKLRDVTQASEMKDRIGHIEAQLKDFATKEELKSAKDHLHQLIKDQDDQLRELSKTQEEQKGRVDQHQKALHDHQLEIQRLDDEIAKLKAQLAELDSKMNDMRSELILKLESMPKEPSTLPIIQQSSALPTDHSDQFKEIYDRLAKLEKQPKPQIITTSNELPQEHQHESVDLTEINKKLQVHDDDINRLYELLDELKKKLKDQQPSGGSALDSEDLLLLKNDIKKLFSLIEQLQTQLNLASFGGSGEGGNMAENQLQIILAEINKVRNLLHDYVTQGDLANEMQKQNLKNKQLHDHVDDEIDKVRREFKNKLDKKVEQADLQKVQNELAHLRDLITKHRRESQIVNTDSPAIKGPQLDPDFLQNFKELQEQVHQIEQELINHKSQFTQHSHQTQLKLQELEKKIQAFQTDKIYQELQNLRELCDKLKNDSEQSKTKIKEFKSRIDQFMTKEEMIAILEPKLKALKDELVKMIEELKAKLEKKADLDELVNVENKFLGKLEEVVNALIKQLANKQETKKALIYLEQKINQIFMILEGEGGSKDAEGLFAKKQLPWSCASCDKELDKFKGQLGDFRGWAVFPPKETSPERMGRFGVGYKQMQEKQKGNREKLDKGFQANNERDNNNRPSSQVNQQFYGTGQNLSQSQTQLPKIKQQ